MTPDETKTARTAEAASDYEWQRQCDEYERRHAEIQGLVDDVLSGEQLPVMLETYCGQELATAIVNAAKNDSRLYNALADVAAQWAWERI